MKTPSILNLFAAALVLTGAAGLFLAGFNTPSLKRPTASGSIPDSPSPTLSSVPVEGHAGGRSGSLITSEAFAMLSEKDQFDLLTGLLKRATDSDVQHFADLVQSLPDAALRTRLLGALDRLADTGAVELVASFLRITDQPEIIAAVQRTIARAAQSETVVYLAEMAAETGRSPAQRAHALSSLALIRNPVATEGLRDVVITFPDPETATAALTSLGKLQSVDAVGALTSLFDRLPPERFAERQAVLTALRNTATEESQALLQDLADNHPQPLVREAALSALENTAAKG